MSTDNTQVNITSTDPIKYMTLAWQIGVVVFYGAVIWITSQQHTTDIAALRVDHINAAAALRAEHTADIKEAREHIANLQSAVSELRGQIKCMGATR